MRTRAALVTVLVALAAAGPARAADVTSWGAYGDARDFITLGHSQVLHPGNTTTLRATLAPWGDYGAFGRPSGGGDGISLAFEPPRGETLRPFNRVGVERLGFQDDGLAGMQLESGNRSCNGIFGRYELRQFELAPDGKPTRLWLIYEAFCDSYTDASFGEIRFNARVPEAQSHVAPGIVRWPVIEARGRTTEVPISYLGSAPVASVAVAGAHPGDFALDPSGCASSAGPCDVRVRFVPTAGGERTATLRFTDTAGGVHETTLEGYAHGGTNAADVELVREGRTVHYTDATTASFQATAGTIETGFSLRDLNGALFYGVFGSASRPLAPGHYPGAVSDWPSPVPWLRFSFTNSRCEEPGGGEFTLNEFRRMPDETLRSFDVEFTALCQDDGQVLARGRWRFRAGATDALPHWLVPGPRDGTLPDSGDPSGGAGDPPGGAGDPPAGPSGTSQAPADPVATTAAPGRPPATTAAPRRPRIAVRWRVGRSTTRIASLVIRGAPPRATVAVRCRGARCPFRSRTVAVSVVGRRLAGLVFRPGQHLELRVGGDVFRYVIRRGRPPRPAHALASGRRSRS